MECGKHCLMGHSRRSMEENSVDNDLKCWELAQEVSEKNFSMLPRNCSWDILLNILFVIFCACLKVSLRLKRRVFFIRCVDRRNVKTA